MDYFDRINQGIDELLKKREFNEEEMKIIKKLNRMNHSINTQILIFNTIINIFHSFISICK